jgi:hypothetical protein
MKCKIAKNIEHGTYNKSGLTPEQIQINKANAKIKREIYSLRSMAQGKCNGIAKQLNDRANELEKELLS